MTAAPALVGTWTRRHHGYPPARHDYPHGFILVAEHGRSLAGVAAATMAFRLEHRGRILWLDELYVIPQWRGRGIGGPLLRETTARASAMGCRAVDLEVDREHGRAESLYQREGFVALPRSGWVKRLD